MCRSGRMFAPTKIWRKWHVKINQGQKYVQGSFGSLEELGF
jgi:ribosomal protein L4